MSWFSREKPKEAVEVPRLNFWQMVEKYGGDYFTVYDAFYKKLMTPEDHAWFGEAFLTPNGMMLYTLHRIVERLDHVR